mgnify:CR=1 FL=1
MLFHFFELEKNRVQYYKINGYDMIDSLNVDNIIKEKQKFIEDFTDEIDASITDSNALTQITVTW